MERRDTVAHECVVAGCAEAAVTHTECPELLTRCLCPQPGAGGRHGAHGPRIPGHYGLPSSAHDGVTMGTGCYGTETRTDQGAGSRHRSYGQEARRAVAQIKERTKQTSCSFTEVGPPKLSYDPTLGVWRLSPPPEEGR